MVCALELTPVNNWFRTMFNMPELIVRNARSISLYISHIRFSLMICLCIFWLLHQVVTQALTSTVKMSMFALAVWFTVFLFLMESVTGLVLILLVGFFTLIYIAVKQKSKWVKRISLLLLLMVPAGTIGYVANMVGEFYYVNEETEGILPEKSALGNAYVHDMDNRQLENGHYVWRYVCKGISLKKI